MQGDALRVSFPLLGDPPGNLGFPSRGYLVSRQRGEPGCRMQGSLTPVTTAHPLPSLFDPGEEMVQVG